MDIFLHDFETPDIIAFAFDDINLFELQCHLHSINQVESPHSNLWRQPYYGNNFERAMQPFQNTITINDQYAGCADNLKELKDILPIAFCH
jgi:hypothetical protein